MPGSKNAILPSTLEVSDQENDFISGKKLTVDQGVSGPTDFDFIKETVLSRSSFLYSESCVAVTLVLAAAHPQRVERAFS